MRTGVSIWYVHNLAQRILDASWGKFPHMLAYKAERAGRLLLKINARGTSQNIPEGFDRDYVAACRILQLGLGRPEVTPVETGTSAQRPSASCGR